VKKIYDNYSEFHTYLQGDTYFKYGGLRLHEIKNADNAKTAAKNNIDSISSPIVTVEQATTSLGQLYKGGTGKTFVPYAMENSTGGGQLCFLQPYTIQIQFLKYLNSSYPASEPPKAEGEPDPEANYEKTEESLKKPSESIDQMDGEPEETTAAGADAGDKKEEKPKTDKYGYSYKNVKIEGADKTDRPSEKKLGASSGDKDPGNSAFALGDDEKASNSVDKQGGALDSILSGLGSAITAGIENAYILTYIFENFSYNTMVQDAVIEAKKAELGESGLSNLATAQGFMKEDLTEIRDAQKTLSGFKKNASNNYLNGAEIEYLLFGNTTPSKNVTYAKASIYAIRFAFNCIYAFTNAEIRNTTMSAGLAVQAATLGVVPYQVVQIVLQLALAAAESAVDLNMMMCGLDVAVVKTQETWMLSVSSAVKAAGEYVAQTAADVAGEAINKVVGGLQKVVDVSADKLKGAIEDVQKDVQESANQAARDVIDSAFGVVTTKIETVLNDMQYKELETKEAALSWVRTQLSTAKSEIENELDTRFGGNDIGKKVIQYIKDEGYIDEVIQQVQTPIETAINNAPTPSEVVDQVLNQLLDIKMQMTTKVTSIVEELCKDVSGYTTDAVNQINAELNGYIAQAGEDLSEEAAKSIREGVTNATNNFVDNTLSKVDTTVDGGVKGGSKSLASIIKFGYKEYLMLFTYLKICIDGIGDSSNNKILLRTADLIQLNVSHASKDKGAAYTHNKNTSFRMTNACTYISITATADLDMFFMDMDIFAAMVEEEPLEGETGTTVETGSTGTTIKYKGLLGY
jgi:F0F1-type ATP synthase membrane subunit b/b'